MEDGALLMNAFGEYCAMCEQPLPNEAYVWHKSGHWTEVPTSWKDVAAGGASSVLPYILLLCRSCLHAATHGTRQHQSPMLLLYPDDAITFSIRSPPRFRYVLKETSIVWLGRDGKTTNPHLETRVLIEADDPQAQATIDYFQLNSSYYDGEGLFTIPFVDRMTQTDVRVEQRTAIYQQASRLVDTFLTDSNSDSSLPLVAMSQLIAAAGYWSVWATVLSKSSADDAIIRDLMLPRSQDWRTGAIPNNPFPGTNLAVLSAGGDFTTLQQSPS